MDALQNRETPMAWFEDPIENKSPAQYVRPWETSRYSKRDKWTSSAKAKRPLSETPKGPTGGAGDKVMSLPARVACSCTGRTHLANEDPNGGAHQHQHTSGIMAGYAASLLTRTANRLAFEAYGRSATTPDILEKVGLAFAQTLETDEAACHASSLL